MTDTRPVSSPLLSLRSRLLFLICLATLPAVLFTFFAAANEREAMLARMEREALQLARLTSHEHAHQIQGTRKLLAWQASKFASADSPAPAAVDSSFLQALLAGHPQLANLGVLSADGQVVASAHALPSYQSWQDNPVFRAALQSRDIVTGTYAISPIFQRPTLNHALAVRDAQGAVAAVLFNGLDLEWLSDLAGQTDLPEAFSLLIVDQQGRVLASKWADGDRRIRGPRRLGLRNAARAVVGPRVRSVPGAGRGAFRFRDRRAAGLERQDHQHLPRANPGEAGPDLQRPTHPLRPGARPGPVVRQARRPASSFSCDRGHANDAKPPVPRFLREQHVGQTPTRDFLRSHAGVSRALILRPSRAS